MAVRLEKAVGSTAEAWLRMQAAYDLAEVRQHEKEIVVRACAGDGVRASLPLNAGSAGGR